jgi:hypothetical protein
MVFSSRVVDPIDVPAAIRELIPDSFSCELDVVTEDSVSALMRESPAATAVRL